MNSRSTLIALVCASVLGGFWYFYEFKGKESREKLAQESKLIFPELNTLQPTELTLSAPGKDSVFLKNDSKGWKILKPLVAEADAMQVEQVLEKLKDLKNEGTVDEKGDHLDDFGFKTASSATFQLSTGSAQTLYFGGDNPSQQYAYARVEGKPAVFMVSRYVKSQIVQELKALRDKTIWSFDPDQVIRIRSNFGKGLTMEKGKGDEWKVVRPQRAQGRKYEIRQWLEQLKDLKVDEFVKEKGANSVTYGLDDGHRLELAFAKAPKSVVLIQGSKLKSGKGRYYKVSGRPLIFSMPDFAGTTVARSSADFVSPTAKK